MTDVQTEVWFSDFQPQSWSLSNTTLQVADSKYSSPESKIAFKSKKIESWGYAIKIKSMDIDPGPL